MKLSPLSDYTPIIAFWVIGAINNLPYIVMLAVAKSISEGGTALVFLANIMPGFLLKLSSPYWFDKVSYKNRMRMGSVLMTLSFIVVATFSYLGGLNDENGASKDGMKDKEVNAGGINFYMLMQLLGVAFCSAQGDLGEATLLALSGRADSFLNHNAPSSDGSKDEKAMCITAYASGTGLAGPLGFGFVVFFENIIGFSMIQTLLIALIFPIVYLFVFNTYLSRFSDGISFGNVENEEEMAFLDDFSTEEELEHIMEEDYDYLSPPPKHSHVNNHENDTSQKQSAMTAFEISRDEFNDQEQNENERSAAQPNNIIKKLSMGERLKLTLSFWPYMVPLFIVYAAEYALQSGVWTAIGFPVEDEVARNSFYKKGNWAYQIGVFLSRTSGAFCVVPMWALWLMPMLQCVNLIFFYFVALYHFWYNNFLLIPCFYAGLLGGSVYVNGYMRINKDLPMATREFALSTVSVADSFGVVVADISGLFIQSCLYSSNNITGAVVSCPIQSNL